MTEQELRALYGPTAVFSYAAGFTLVHLDNPPLALSIQRTIDFDPATFFEQDCAICAQNKKTGVVVFDERPEAEEHES